MESRDDGVSIDLPAPEGWKKIFTPRKAGTPRRNDVVFISPTGEEIKNKRQLDQYLKAHPGSVSASDFDWGTGDTPRRSARLTQKSKATETPEGVSPQKKPKRGSSSKKGAKEKKEEKKEDNEGGEGEVAFEEKMAAAASEETKPSEEVEMKNAEDEGDKIKPEAPAEMEAEKESEPPKAEEKLDEMSTEAPAEKKAEKESEQKVEEKTDVVVEKLEEKPDEMETEKLEETQEVDNKATPSEEEKQALGNKEESANVEAPQPILEKQDAEENLLPEEMKAEAEKQVAETEAPIIPPVLNETTACTDKLAETEAPVIPPALNEFNAPTDKLAETEAPIIPPVLNEMAASTDKGEITVEDVLANVEKESEEAAIAGGRQEGTTEKKFSSDEVRPDGSTEGEDVAKFMYF